MEVEEEFLQNAASMVRFAEAEIKQFLTWTGSRSPYNRSAEEIKAKLQAVASDIKLLKKEYTDSSTGEASIQKHPRPSPT
jgi:hypothetical protein